MLNPYYSYALCILWFPSCKVCKQERILEEKRPSFTLEVRSGKSGAEHSSRRVIKSS